MSYKVAVILLILEAIARNIVLVRGDCFTPDGFLGDCINLRNCPSLLNKLTSSNRQQSDIQLVKDSTCGFEGKAPKVCCPNINSFEQPNDSFKKQGENNYEQQNLNVDQKENIDNSQPPDLDSFAFPEEIPRQPESKLGFTDGNRELLPFDCGTYLANRIFGGTVTELEEYPWLSLLEYRKANGKKALSCGGAIINERYILTAAHCIVGAGLPKSWRLESVRLGEYNTTADRDCIFDDNGSTCVEDPPLTVRVVEHIVHENYNPYSTDQRHDIALLRLAESVAFTSYIKPICLPNHSKINQNLTVAGWGSTESRKASDVKLKVVVPLVDTQQCSDAYRPNGINLGEGQLCAGGEIGKDSCRGDSGGPLMQQKQEMSADSTPRWEAIGVVSFGPSPCGQAGFPGVYTKIYDYMPWIMNKLRP